MSIVCELPGCNNNFEPRGNSEAQRFCSHEHQRIAKKRRYYSNHREEILTSRRVPVKNAVRIDNESWRAVVDYEGSYEVSDYGRVRSVDRQITDILGRTRFVRGQVLKPKDNGNGYLYVYLCVDNTPVHRYIHELVLIAFVGERPNGMQSCHGPNGKSDNSVGNLEWNTPGVNNGEHKRRDGTNNPGEVNTWAKFTDVQAREVYARVKAGERQCDLAAEFGVSRPTLHKIVVGKTWKHLNLEVA